MSVIDLQETSPNEWRAKYKGNFGIYTIKLRTNGKKSVNYSCSCPSSYYPCKHIAKVEKAIEEYRANNKTGTNSYEIAFDQLDAGNKKNANGYEIAVDQLLKELSQKELCDFIVKQAYYNQDLKNTILLEFSHRD